MFQVLIEKDGKIEVYRSNISDQYKAERIFLDAVADTISNFDEYSSEDIDAIVYQQYENFGRGRVYFEEV